MSAQPARTTPMEEFLEGVWRQNPVFVMVLGMCPVMAVTVSAVNALAMGLATTFVLTGSALLVSLLRHWVPREVRIATYIVIIASFVTVVDYLIQAVSLALHTALGAFIQLIVVNCIILGRAEAHPRKTRPCRRCSTPWAWAWAFPSACSPSGRCARSSAPGGCSAWPSSAPTSSPGG